MFSLFSGIWAWWHKKTELRFLLLGLDNAGKTTTLEQIKRLYQCNTPEVPLERISPTVGLNLCSVNFDSRTSGIFWDLGGSLILRGIWEKHYSECDGVIFVIDSVDVGRMMEVKATLSKLTSHRTIIERSPPLVLLLNKQDVSDCEGIKSIIDRLGFIIEGTLSTPNSLCVIPYPTTRNCTESSVPCPPNCINIPVVCIAACSAIKNVNIKEAIDCLVRYNKWRVTLVVNIPCSPFSRQFISPLIYRR